MVATRAVSEMDDEPDHADRAITGAFALLRAAIDDPDVLMSLPDDATVEFRDVVIEGFRFALVAASGEDSDAWMARPFRYAHAESPPPIARPTARPSQLKPEQIAEFKAMRTQGLSPDAALDSLERDLFAVVNRARRESRASFDG